MIDWLRQRMVTVIFFAVAVIAVGFFVYGALNPKTPDWVTAEVEVGDVRELVSISGFVEAKNTARLSFPTTGRITEIFVTEGEEVEAGALLATLGQSQVAAQRRAAQANVVKAEAVRDELMNGQTLEERAVTDATVAQARAAWEQTVATELQKVQNALIALYSNNLTAYSIDPEENAPAPVISGSYTCADAGEYTLRIYRSSTDSGYSYRYEGIETGVGTVASEHPDPIGSCGLEAQFTPNGQYAATEWVIPIPNTRSNTYATYVNALALAEQQAAQNIQAAKDVLTLAENSATKETAAPRVEALLSANASVSVAQAELARIDALLTDQSISAPFAGTIVAVDKLSGEVATTEPFITLLAEDAFTLTARIPEIDITKIAVGQKTDIVFDANTKETLTGEVEYISPLAVEIDGVAYFKARIVLDEVPLWMRSGLNADIEITTKEVLNVLRIPTRFLISENNAHYVLLPEKEKVIKSGVETGFEGNDGYIEVRSLSKGAKVVAP
jgi:multidrug efflux pump subunit AcrA (membrane-fusion protein)